MSHVFISYSRDDREFVKEVADGLKRSPHAPFMDESDIEPGDVWERSIEDAVGGAYAVLVFVSKSAVESKWVAKEIEFARGSVTKIKIIPVILDDTELPESLEEYEWVDFSQAVLARGAAAKRKYDEAFSRLIGALNEINPMIVHCERLRKEPRSRDREEAARHLGQYREPRVERELLQALRGENEEDVQFEIIRSLGKLESQDAREPIEGMLQIGSNIDLRAAAARALGRIGDPESIGLLKECLSEPKEDRLVRQEVARALGDLRAHGCIELLIHMMRNDPIGEVRGAARDAVTKIGGKSADRALRRLRSETTTQPHAPVEGDLHALTSLLLFPDPPMLRESVDRRIEERRELVIGCQEFTESRIICAILAELLERDLHGKDTFERVVPRFNLGGASRNFVSLARGEVDVFSVYTGTGFEFVFPSMLTPEEVRKRLKTMAAGDAVRELNRMYETYPIEWVCHTGSRNDWQLVMRWKDTVGEKAIEKISDLRNFPRKLSLGCEHDFTVRPGGLEVLGSVPPNGYGIQFKDVRQYQHRDIYRALAEEEVDVIDGSTSHPDIKHPQFRQLEDDEFRLGSYHSAIVARHGLLEQCPQIRTSLLKLKDQLNGVRMGSWIREAERHAGDELHIKNVREIAAKFVQNQILKG